ncbi:MAG: hypothetical protein NVSMB31_20580 [Vulcanimicrobiaceae bacterium]
MQTLRSMLALPSPTLTMTAGPNTELAHQNTSHPKSISAADRIERKHDKDDSVADRIAAAFPKNLRKHVHATVVRLLNEMHRDGITNPAQQADILGQTDLETTMGINMRERVSEGAYENRADLGNTQKGDGSRFGGRGYIQITGRASYTYWGHRLGVDLLKHPELAANPDNAAKIAVLGMRDGTFTGMTADGHRVPGGGEKLSDFIDDKSVDFLGSRRIVNGQDRARELLQKATEYFGYLKNPR